MVTFVRDRVEKDQDKLIKLERKINPLLGGYSNILSEILGLFQFLDRFLLEYIEYLNKFH